MKHRFFLFALLLVLLTSCGQTHKKYVIGVSQCSMDSWREKFIDELKNMALITDSVALRIATANDDDQRQEAQIDSLIGTGVDLLIVSPNQLNTISPAIDRAVARGIPVVLYDRKSNSQHYTAFIGCDNREIGRAMGRYIAQQLDGHGQVVELMGLRGSSPAIERHRGFTEALSSYPGIQLVATASGDWKEQSGQKAMARILREHPHIDYVFSHNDRMALGARKEAQRQGRLHGMRFTGVDALATDGGGLELVRDSILDATYLYPTKGHEVLALALKILGRKPYQRDNYLQASIVTHDNAALTLMEAKDAEHQRSDLSTLHRQVDSYVAQYRSQRIITIALVIILALAVAIVVIVYRALVVKQRLNQEVMELTHSRLVFFTNISHELRTPLTLIADPVELLLADPAIQDKQRTLLTMVQRNARALQHLVDSILDFRKVQNDKMTLAPSRFNLVEALRTWTDDFQLSAQRRDIHLALDTSRYAADPYITADKDKVNRIVFNLLSNALKHTPRGGSITVVLQTDGDQLRIDICDTGRGMSQADADRIFERFFQAKGTTGGTCIGLALVKAYAELHHGSVGVSSEEGKGSDFWVRMPLIGARGEERGAREMNFGARDEERGTRETGEKAHLLIIDDNADIREYLHTLLDDSYIVSEACDGKEGLAAAERDVPDLVVCDVMMPVMDGLSFCHQLKTTTSTSHIPVIMLTAKAMDEHRAEGYEQGADSYITKPFQSRVLLARISNLLHQRDLLRQHFAAAQPSITETPALNAQSSKLNVQCSKFSAREQAFMKQVSDVIDAHLGDSDFSVEDIGQEIGLSRVQLYRKVKALTGTSVVDLLRKARLDKARQLLATTGKTISEVAYETGFSAPSYFAKCFRDEFGITPSDFCQQA